MHLQHKAPKGSSEYYKYSRSSPLPIGNQISNSRVFVSGPITY